MAVDWGRRVAFQCVALRWTAGRVFAEANPGIRYRRAGKGAIIPASRFRARKPLAHSGWIIESKVFALLRLRCADCCPAEDVNGRVERSRVEAVGSSWATRCCVGTGRCVGLRLLDRDVLERGETSSSGGPGRMGQVNLAGHRLGRRGWRGVSAPGDGCRRAGYVVGVVQFFGE